MVVILAFLLFGESIGVVGAAGLVLGVVGLLLLEVNIPTTFIAVVEVLCISQFI